MLKRIVNILLRNEKGQAMTEYGLILALIAVVVVGVLIIMGGQLEGVFQSISDNLPSSGT